MSEVILLKKVFDSCSKLLDIVMSDIYWGISMPAQGLLMLYGLPPTNPYETVKEFKRIFVDKESIRKEFSDIYLWNNELFEEINKKAEKQSNQLFNFDKIFEDNIGDFFFTNKKMYNDLLYTEHDERGKFFDNYSLTNWIDIHTYQILCFKKMVEDIEHLKFFTDYIDKLILDEEKILANTFFVQKKTTLTKNYLILFSILTQILSLVTLLFLFRNLIKKR